MTTQGSTNISKYTILGERCSSTNLLEKLMSGNFDLSVTWEFGWKHFFGFSDFHNSDETLFIGIVRSPLAWINSLRNLPHHVHSSLLQNKESFLVKLVTISFGPNNTIP